jgi:hypothetical protein
MIMFGMHKVMLSKSILTKIFLWELGYPARIMSGSSTLEGNMEIEFSGIVCIATLRLRGLKGDKSTPINDWEVPVRSQRLERRSGMEHDVGQ